MKRTLNDVKRAGTKVVIFGAKFDSKCYYCDHPIRVFPGGTELVARINDGALRHYRCVMQELGVTIRADGVTPI